MLFTRILIPIDFSEPSIEALRLAVSIGMKEGARLTLLYVDNAALPDTDALANMHRLVAKEIPSSVHFSIEVDQGNPAEKINHHALAGQHDLVVMGTHGKQGLERVILGSVAETVVRTCPVPVLVTHDRSG